MPEIPLFRALNPKSSVHVVQSQPCYVVKMLPGSHPPNATSLYAFRTVESNCTALKFQPLSFFPVHPLRKSGYETWLRTRRDLNAYKRKELRWRLQCNIGSTGANVKGTELGSDEVVMSEVEHGAVSYPTPTMTEPRPAHVRSPALPPAHFLAHF